MTLKLNNFNAGAFVGDGTTISIANSDDAGESAFSAVSIPGAATGVYDNDDAPTGLQWSGLFGVAASTAPIVALGDTGSNNFAAAVYMKISANPSIDGTLGMRTQTTAAAQGAKGYISSAGKLQIVGAFGTTTSSGTSVPVGSWFRMELTCSGNGTTASFTQSWYTEHGTSPGDTISANGVAYALDCAEIRYGIGNTAPGTGLTVALAAIRQNIGSASALGPVLFGTARGALVGPSLAAQQSSRW